jgi:hypothetical protein
MPLRIQSARSGCCNGGSSTKRLTASPNSCSLWLSV